MSQGGGAFLSRPTAPECVHIPEDLSHEARLMAATMEQFVRTEVLPRTAALEAHEPGLLRRLLEEAGQLSLLASAVPPEYSGLGLSRSAVVALCERAALAPSFALAHNVHSGVATLPLAWFGDTEQKARYLPALARGEAIGAFALTEANAGSDALATRCRAVPVAGGGYRLTGTKNWITNAGIADLFTVFARVPNAGVTAFLVERAAPGVRVGREEEKLGLRGTSTCALFLDDVLVSAGGVLGEPGRGHRVALHPLNVGRLNIAAGAVGAAKDNLARAAEYACGRRQFGRSLSEFGLIREKLGEMAARIFAAESIVYRVAGLLDAHSAKATVLPPPAAEEYAIECALAKIYATEALAFVVDESLQIHGGYGYSEALPVARAYRDARVTRIFEGTNEINRLTVIAQIGRRLKEGRLALCEAPAVSISPIAALRATIGEMLTALGDRHRPERIADEAQEAAGACADAIVALFAAESATLRAARRTGAFAAEAADAATVVLDRACRDIRASAHTVCRSIDDRALWARIETRLPELWEDMIAVRRRLAEGVAYQAPS